MQEIYNALYETFIGEEYQKNGEPKTMVPNREKGELALDEKIEQWFRSLLVHKEVIGESFWNVQRNYMDFKGNLCTECLAILSF